ncbi:cytospin-B-like isoform X2 [Dunckerocampus dactyliophorus]|uniref:cytospin-B-like isoform X2 n=1 Tax=Dunckerocampus dactyliophorus TaxID=161453 RepID=UPI0024060673|nr:cytospin-B-like isoform X2 [Dunckerocampus dactyliophorus]
MGNTNGHSSGGSPLDLFQTAPTTPSEADLSALALSVCSSSSKTQTPSIDMAAHASLATTFAVTDWAQKLSPPSEWAVISVDSVVSPETNISDEVAGHEEARAVSLPSLSSVPASRAWPSEQSWQERDSGLEPQAAAETSAEDLSLSFHGLVERYKTSLGISPSTSMGAEELLRHFIAERDRLTDEVNSLREMLKAERLEWHRFQCDMQIAVSVADRLRAESEQALAVLQGKHRSVQNQLAQAHSRRQETERELERVRSEQRDVCTRLSALEVQQQREQEMEDTTAACGETPETQDSEKVRGMEIENATQEDEVTVVKGQKEEPETNDETSGKSFQLTGKGIAEGYLRSLAAREKKKEGRSQSEPRKIVMLSERSWSMSRLPLPADAVNNNNTSSTLPSCKKEEPTRARNTTHGLKRVDSCSSFHAGKRDENPNSDTIKPQDRVRSVPRRHGGSRRNSLLFWCQSRTQGYQHLLGGWFGLLCGLSHLPAHSHPVQQPQPSRQGTILLFMCTSLKVMHYTVPSEGGNHIIVTRFHELNLFNNSFFFF